MDLKVNPGRRIMGRLAKGDDLLGALERRAGELGLKLGEVRALGAVSAARVGFYDQAARQYRYLDFREPLEIVALMGNVSLKDGKPFVHAHVTLADAQGRAWGGHLAAGTPVFACEFVLQEYESEESLVRGLDEETGLFLWPR
jgi:uncharacterized protein